MVVKQDIQIALSKIKPRI